MARRLAAEDARASERWPGGDRLRRWLEQDWDTAVALGAVRRLVYEGNLKGALEVADDALARARRDPKKPDRIGSFSFQRGDVLRMRGQIDEARDELLKGLAGVSSTSLALWEEFTRLACAVAVGQPLSADELDSAGEVSEVFDSIAETGGALWVQVMLAVDDKNQGRMAEAARELAVAQQGAKKQRLEQLVSLAALHRADAHRLLGEFDAMTAAMEGVGPWCLHPLFAEVLQLSAGHSGRASWSTLGEKFEEQGCAHGSGLVGRVLTSHAGDPVPPQPDLRLTFL